MLKENFDAVYAEDAAVADSAAFAGGQYLDIAPTAVEVVAQGDAVMRLQDRAVGFPHGNIDRVAAVEHCSCGGYMDRASHWLRVCRVELVVEDAGCFVGRCAEAVDGKPPCEFYLVELFVRV